MIGTIFFATAALLSAPSIVGKWNYVQLDNHNHVTVTGSITIRRGANHSFTGNKSLTPKARGAAVQTGLIYASIEGGKVHIDLNAGMADNNILLTGVLKGSRIAGTWGHSTFVGIRERGTFTMARVK